MSLTPEPIAAAVVPAGYLTVPLAESLTGRDQKTLERYAREGRLRRVHMSRPGLRPSPVYHEEDLLRLKSDIDRRAENAKPEPNRSLVLPAQMPALLQQFLAAATAAAPTTVQPQDRQLLTMSEAHRLGWPVAILRQLRASDTPPGLRYGVRGFRFSRLALERIALERIGATPEPNPHA